MNTADLLLSQVKDAHQFLGGITANLTPDQAHWVPPGTANPIGATYVHVLVSEDLTTSLLLKGGTPLFASTFAGKAGFSEPMPMPGPDWAGYRDWTRRLRVDLPALREYATAVFASTEEYLSSLTPEDIDRTLDLSMLEMGTQSVGYAISTLIVAHSHDIAGEISCLKGLQGLVGYE